jgi:signal transduction histidine kinase
MSSVKKQTATIAQRLVNAQEEERKRIARDVHDDLGNRIALLAFSVRRIMDQQTPGTPVLTELREVLIKIMDLANALRDLSHDLHPPILQYAGIGVALKWLCEEFEARSDIHVTVGVPAAVSDIPEDVSLCLFRVAQECLQNIAKHSGARSARVSLECSPGFARLKVSDTGIGFTKSHANRNRGLGILSMKERVHHLAGRLEIGNGPDLGTEVQVIIPLSASRKTCAAHAFYSQTTTPS